MKIELDKYYTLIEVANHCWEVVEKYVDFSTIKRIIEELKIKGRVNKN